MINAIRFDDCIEGGESVWLDGFLVVEEMRRRFPQHFKTLTEVSATIGVFSSKMLVSIYTCNGSEIMVRYYYSQG